MVTEIDLSLAPKPEVALTARKALDPLAELLPPAKFEDVRLVVGKLVANSILHAGLSSNDRISLSVAVLGGSVRGKVCDSGSGFEVPSEPEGHPRLLPRMGSYDLRYRRRVGRRSLGGRPSSGRGSDNHNPRRQPEGATESCGEPPEGTFSTPPSCALSNGASSSPSWRSGYTGRVCSQD
jgi:hypothetical protein